MPSAVPRYVRRVHERQRIITVTTQFHTHGWTTGRHYGQQTPTRVVATQARPEIDTQAYFPTLQRGGQVHCLMWLPGCAHHNSRTARAMQMPSVRQAIVRWRICTPQELAEPQEVVQILHISAVCSPFSLRRNRPCRPCRPLSSDGIPVHGIHACPASLLPAGIRLHTILNKHACKCGARSAARFLESLNMSC